jgi:hypothetical protein
MKKILVLALLIAGSKAMAYQLKHHHVLATTPMSMPDDGKCGDQDQGGDQDDQDGQGHIKSIDEDDDCYDNGEGDQDQGGDNGDQDGDQDSGDQSGQG